jgi:hypothetical protein
MGKFLIREVEVITEPECTTMAWTSVTSYVEQDKTRAKKQKKITKVNHKKYDEAYREWGFSYTQNGLKPLCVVCGVTLSNPTIQ